MPYNPNDPRLPINPSNENLKGLFGRMTEAMGPGGAEVPERYNRELENIKHPPVDVDPHYPDHEFPGKVNVAATSLGGIAKAIAHVDVKGRADERAARLEHRLDVATHVALRLLQPRITGASGESISWIGTHKLTDPTDTSKRPSPNWYRPSTRSELSVVGRLERGNQKMRGSHNHHRHLSESYTTDPASTATSRALHDTGVSKAGWERKHLRGISKDVDNHAAKGSKHDSKFERIANAKDFRGRLVSARLRRANRIRGNPSARSKPLVEINAAHLRSTAIPRSYKSRPVF